MEIRFGKRSVQLAVSRANPSSSSPGVDKPDKGSVGKPSRYGGIGRDDYNPALRGAKGIETITDMRKGDSKFASSLLLVKAPILSGQWYMEPFSDDPIDIEAADLAWWALNSMRRPYLQTIRESMHSLEYGHYAFHKAFEMAKWTPKRDGAHERTIVKWRKMSPRHPLTLVEWVTSERNGEVLGVWHQPQGQSRGSRERIYIPIEELLLYTWDEEAEDPTGNSMARPAYGNWYYKHNLYKVDAIQKERHGIGIPRVHLPPGYSLEDKELAEQMGANLRTNEKAHIVQLPNWDVDFVEPRGQMVDVLASAEHHNFEIGVNFLVQFMSMKQGSNSLGSTQSNMAEKAQKNLADFVRAPINHEAIPELMQKNYLGLKGYPELKVRRLTDNADYRAFAVAARNLIEAGLLTPDDDSEQFAREYTDMPRRLGPSRSVKSRFSREGTRGGGQQGTGSKSPGQKDDGTSPAGNPTE